MGQANSPSSGGSRYVDSGLVSARTAFGNWCLRRGNLVAARSAGVPTGLRQGSCWFADDGAAAALVASSRPSNIIGNATAGSLRIQAPIVGVMGACCWRRLRPAFGCSGHDDFRMIIIGIFYTGWEHGLGAAVPGVLLLLAVLATATSSPSMMSALMRMHDKKRFR